MELFLYGLLGIFVLVYAIVIFFYIENLGFFKKINFDWKKEFLLLIFGVGLIAMQYFFEELGALITLIFVGVPLIWFFFRNKNYLEDLLTLLIFLFGLASVVNFPQLVFQAEHIQINQVQLVVIISFAIGALWFLHWKFKDRVESRIFESINLKMTLLTVGTALLLFQAHLNPDFLNEFYYWTFELLEPVLFVLLFTFLSVLAYINVVHTDRHLKAEKEKAEQEAFEKYTDQLERSYDTLRVIKHDYANIMTSLKLYIDEKDVEGLAEYYYSEFAELTRVLNDNNDLADQLQRVRGKELKSILLHKLNLALDLKLKVKLEVRHVMGNLPVSKLKFCQVIGILLDNAIEASVQTDERLLNVAILKTKDQMVFIIENSWEQVRVPLKKFFEKGYSTKGSGRGLGLAVVEEWVDKQELVELDSQVSESSFMQILKVRG